GQANALSFNQFKNITCGEGGAMLTNVERIYHRMMIYHDTGCYTRPHASQIKVLFFAGQNYRASEIMGAMLGVQLSRLDGVLRGLQTRRALLAKLLAHSPQFVVGRHNDPAHAVALTIQFPTAKEAKEFVEQHQGLVSRPIDSGRHVYPNWQPLLEQNVVHPKLNPYAWAH